MTRRYDSIRVEQDGPVTVLTLDRPEAHNALTPQAYDELDDAIRRCDARCIVLTGEGRTFCTGDDIRVFMTGDTLADYLDAHLDLSGPTEALLYTDIPVIAAVNGVAVGWGMELAIMADIRLASTTARFGEVYALRGLCSDVAGMGRLAQLIGREQAAKLLFTGEIIDAHRAAAIGLVSETVPPQQLTARAMALARQIAANPPLAIRRLKAGLRAALDPDWREFGHWVRRAQAELARTEDHHESVAAFLDKRPANYSGR